MNKASKNLLLLLALVPLACRVADPDDPPPIDQWGTGESANPTGVGDDGNDGMEPTVGDGTGADETGEMCEPDIGQFKCRGLAYSVYCKSTDDNDCVMEVLPNGGNYDVGTSRTAICVEEGHTGNASHYGAEIPGVCGMWAGSDYTYNDYTDPIANDLEAECQAMCQATIAADPPGPASFTTSGGTITWNFSHVDCFFGNEYEAFTVGQTKAISNGVTYAGILSSCGFSGNPPTTAFEPDTSVSPIVPCGEEMCTIIDCSEYTASTDAGTDYTNGTNMISHVEKPFAQLLRGNMPLGFCDVGRYVWDLDSATRSKFEGLASGNVYYQVGLRNSDRILELQAFNPATCNGSTATCTLTGSAYTIDDPLDLAAAFDSLLLGGSGDKYIAVKFKRSGSNWRTYVKVE